MNLEEGRLYNVHGLHIYGAGFTSTKHIESWKQIMYIQNEHIFQDGENKSHIFLADGDQHGDVCDNCPDNCNDQQLDADNDGIGDVCDDPNDDGCGSGCQPACEVEC